MFINWRQPTFIESFHFGHTTRGFLREGRLAHQHFQMLLFQLWTGLTCHLMWSSHECSTRGLVLNLLGGAGMGPSSLWRMSSLEWENRSTGCD